LEANSNKTPEEEWDGRREQEKSDDLTQRGKSDILGL